MSDFFTFQNSVSGSSEFNKMHYAIRRYLAHIRTAQLAKIINCTNSGGLTAVGTVDIQLLLNQTDGAGNATALPPVYTVPYLRMQGGTNAVIIDPQPGDIGVVVFGDRDLSAVIASKVPSAPGSNRRFSLSDALWIGGMLNDTPQQYVQFNTSGITVVSPQTVTIQAPTITLQGNTHITGTLRQDGAQTNNSTITASGEIKSGSHTLTQHVHPGVQTGSGNTATPTG